MRYLALLTSLALILTLAPAVSAQTNEICDYLTDNLSLEDKAVPGFIPYGNERANIYTQNNQTVAHVITEQRNITSVGCEEIDAPTYTVYVHDSQTLERIFYSDKPLSQLEDEKKEGYIEVRGETFTKQLKNTATNLATRVLSWFGI